MTNYREKSFKKSVSFILIIYKRVGFIHESQMTEISNFHQDIRQKSKSLPISRQKYGPRPTLKINIGYQIQTAKGTKDFLAIVTFIFMISCVFIRKKYKNEKK